MRAIFVAGCARSGTTLMLRLMRAFDGVEVIDGEHGPERCTHDGDHVRVVKRNSTGWQHLPGLDPSTGILYMVRHPWDVLTSYHPRTRSRGYHVTPKRWMNEYGAWKKIRSRHGTAVVRYEDLIQHPRETQERIAEAFGLSPAATFHAVEQMYTSSIGRHTRSAEAAVYIGGLQESLHADVRAFREEFGYG